MKKNNFFALLTLVGFLLPAGAMALPQMSKVESGSANAVEVGSSMIIEASDNAIVDYRSFGIAENEKVQFIQPNSNSVILNRIVGEDASDILGSLNSNGKVFLVNPNGVYFGPNAKVDVGSLISSTLDIANENFLAGNYKFINGGGEGTIINLGSLSAPEGVIALISPDIQNEGIISAKAGKVVLATGENVTVDFYGDSLMNFAVDNTTYAKETGKIKMTADKAAGIILDVVNNDEISEGTKFVKRDGIIRIVEDSSIEAKEVVICGKENSTIVVNGTIDASSYYGDSVGGKIEIYGEKITVDNANILAYGDAKGGEIFIGGNWYGENSVFNAKETILKENSVVSTNALFNGDGGKVCVWSDDSTTFNGVLSARGGQFSGKGGFVETSSGGFVGSLDSYVDTYSATGETGMWSIDPAHIIIGSRGVDSLESAEEANDTLSLRMLNSAVFRKATSNIVLRALSEAGTVTIDDGSSISIPEGYGISFDVDPNYGVIFLKTGAYVETAGGDVIFNGPVMLEGDSCFVKTNANGATGGDVIFNYAINGQGLSDFAIDAGKGKVVFAEEVGKRVPVGAININAGKIDLYASMNTKGRPVTLNAPMNFFDDLSIDTAVNSRTGADVTFNEDINGSYNLVVNASDSIFAHNADIGNKIPLKSLKVKAADTRTSGNVHTYGGTQIYASAITLGGGGVTVTHEDTGPDGIFYLNTIDGDTNGLTVNAKAGTVVMVGAITDLGADTRDLTVTARHVKQQAAITLNAAADLTYNGTESITISGGITAATTGTITINDPCQIVGATTFTTISGALQMNGVVEGTGALTVASTSGTITLQTDPFNLYSLTATNVTGDIAITAPIIASGNVTVNFTTSGTHTQSGDITTLGGNVSFGANGTRNINCDINTNGGNITFSGAIAQLSGNIFTGSGDLTASAAITLNGATNMNVGSGTVAFSADILGANALNIVGDNTGTCTFTTIGAGTDPTNVGVSIGTITFGGAVSISGLGSFYGNAINCNGASITSTASSLAFNGPVILGASTVSFDTTGGGGDISFLSTINSDSSTRTLSVNAGAAGGIVTFGASLGDARTLGEVDVTAQKILLGGNINMSTANACIFTSAILLTADAVIYNASTGGITISSNIDGAYDLAITPSSTGTVTLGGSLGTKEPLDHLTVGSTTGTGAITIGVGSAVTIFTSDAQVYYNPVTLAQNTTLIDTGSGIIFSGTNVTVNGGFTFECDAYAGTISLAGIVGGSTPPTAITLVGLGIEQFADMTSSGTITITGTDHANIRGDLTTSGASNITCTNPVTLSGTRTFTIATGNININGATGFTGALTCTDGASAGTTTIGSDTMAIYSLNVTTDTINVNAPIHAVSDIDIGPSASAATTIAFASGVDLATGGGNVSISSGTAAITATGVDMTTQGGSVSFTTSHANGVSYGGVIHTDGGNLNFVSSANLTLGADTVFNLGSGACEGTNDVGTINGAFSLKVIGNDAGVMEFGGIIGGSAAPTELVAEIGKVKFGAAATVAGKISIVSNDITFTGNITGTAASSNITVIGPSVIATTTTFQVGATSDILFLTPSSTIDGAQALAFVLATATDVLKLEGEIGGINAVTSFTSAHPTILLGNNINATGAIAMNASSGKVTLIGDSQVYSSGSTIAFGQTIDGFYNLFLEASSTITCSGNIGSTIALRSLVTNAGGAVTLRDVTTRY